MLCGGVSGNACVAVCQVMFCGGVPSNACAAVCLAMHVRRCARQCMCGGVPNNACAAVYLDMKINEGGVHFVGIFCYLQRLQT